MELNYFLEAAVLPVELLLCVYLRLKYRDTSEVNKRFRRMAYMTNVATLLDVLYAVVFNTHAKMPAFIYVLADMLAHMAALAAAFFFLAYILSFARGEHPFARMRLGILTSVGAYLVFWAVNPFTGIIVSYDEYGYYRQGILYMPLVFVFPLLVLLSGYLFMILNRSFYDRWQWTAVIASFATAAIVYLVQMLFYREILMIFFIGAVDLYIMFFCLETPVYRQLSKQKTVLEEAQNTADKARLKAENANVTKAEILGRISETTRKNVNLMVEADTRMLRASMEPEVTALAKEMRQKGLVVARVLNDIADLSQLETRQLQFHDVHYSLGHVLTEAEEAVSARAQKKGLDFRTEFVPGVPDELYGDEQRVKQVLMNLLDNAVQFTNAGSVTFSVAGRRHYEKVQLHIEVIDTGRGIKEEDLATLYEPFKSVTDADAKDEQNAGLSLAITRLLAERMEGGIDVTSKRGEGTSFHVTLMQRVTGEKTLGEYFKEQQYIGGRS